MDHAFAQPGGEGRAGLGKDIVRTDGGVSRGDDRGCSRSGLSAARPPPGIAFVAYLTSFAALVAMHFMVWRPAQTPVALLAAFGLLPQGAFYLESPDCR